MSSDIFIPTKKRKILAWYIDFLFLFVIFDFIDYFLVFFSFTNLGKTVLFLVIESILIKKSYSAGYFVLSIYRDPDLEIKYGKKPYLIVDSTIKKTEHWLTMILGTCFILEGTKSLVRWMQGLPILPMMGFIWEGNNIIIISILYGILLVYVGISILKLERKAFWLILIVSIALLIGSTLSFHQWPEVIAKIVQIRRGIQGLAVHTGEIEFMQKIMPLGVIITSVILAGSAIIMRKRFIN